MGREYGTLCLFARVNCQQLFQCPPPESAPCPRCTFAARPRARAEALPGLIKRLAVAYMADGTRPFVFLKESWGSQRMTLCDRRRLKHSCSAALSARSSLRRPSTPAAHAGPSCSHWERVAMGGAGTGPVLPCSHATIGGSGSVGEGVAHALRHRAVALSRNGHRYFTDTLHDLYCIRLDTG